MSHCYCNLQLLQWSECPLILKRAQTEHQISSGPLLGVICELLIYVLQKRGASKISTIKISPQQNCRSWVIQGLFCLYFPPETLGASRMGRMSAWSSDNTDLRGGQQTAHEHDHTWATLIFLAASSAMPPVCLYSNSCRGDDHEDGKLCLCWPGLTLTVCSFFVSDVDPIRAEAIFNDSKWGFFKTSEISYPSF